jgi:hypothetical protein
MEHTKRVCIVGTAESHRQTPWADPGLEIWSLNDAYSLGFPRANRWFELHPLDRMYFRDPRMKVVYADQVPKGFYVRPAGHLDWLKSQAATIPIYLQNDPPDGWPPNAQRFPIEQITAAFGANYWASGPSYMLALAVLEGYTEIWVTGIHLATAHEYREQRPQWEHLLGRLLGPHVTESKANGFRVYDGAIRLVLPESCPILHHPWRYAYDDKPVMEPDALDIEWKAIQKEKAKLVQALVNWPKGKDKSRQIERLRRIEIVEMDIQQCRQKRAMGGTLAVSLG